jgi:hypothetical protein
MIELKKINVIQAREAEAKLDPSQREQFKSIPAISD